LLIEKTGKEQANFGNKEIVTKKNKKSDNSKDLRNALKTVILKKKENARSIKENSPDGSRGCDCTNLFGPCGMRLCESIKQKQELMSKKKHSKASSISSMPTIKGTLSVNDSALNLKF
jgi:hypothetical protein